MGVFHKKQQCWMSSVLKLRSGKWRIATCSRFRFVVNNGRQSYFTGGCRCVRTTCFSARERIVLSLTFFQLKRKMWCGPFDSKAIPSARPHTRTHTTNIFHLTDKKWNLKHTPFTKASPKLNHNSLQKWEQAIWICWKPPIPCKLVRVCENLLENN